MIEFIPRRERLAQELASLPCSSRRAAPERAAVSAAIGAGVAAGNMPGQRPEMHPVNEGCSPGRAGAERIVGVTCLTSCGQEFALLTHRPAPRGGVGGRGLVWR